MPMRDCHRWIGRPHTGIRLSKLATEPELLYGDRLLAEPTCDRHSTALELVGDSDLPESLTLESGRELLACPQCFDPESDDVDGEKLADAIAREWSAYGEHFEETDPPGDGGPRFEFV